MPDDFRQRSRMGRLHIVSHQAPEGTHSYICSLARSDTLFDEQTFQTYMQFKEIPRKLLVAKRLSQCLNPALPNGVHQRALDVYSHVLAVIGVRFAELAAPKRYTHYRFSLTDSAETLHCGLPAFSHSSSTQLHLSRSAKCYYSW
jgi:hypothetical protein